MAPRENGADLCAYPGLVGRGRVLVPLHTTNLFPRWGRTLLALPFAAQGQVPLQGLATGACLPACLLRYPSVRFGSRCVVE